MTGAQEIELLVKAEEDTAETAIREIAQVERCEKTESKEDGAVQLFVTAKKMRMYARRFITPAWNTICRS